MYGRVKKYVYLHFLSGEFRMKKGNKCEEETLDNVDGVHLGGCADCGLRSALWRVLT
jgi:hypothetical protein